jgi:hypothetical protein
MTRRPLSFFGCDPQGSERNPLLLISRRYLLLLEGASGRTAMAMTVNPDVGLSEPYS